MFNFCSILIFEQNKVEKSFLDYHDLYTPEKYIYSLWPNNNDRIVPEIGWEL